MSLEVLVMASFSCDQNLRKKGIYCPLTIRCQPLVLFTSELAWDKWPAPNLVWELDRFLRWPPAKCRTKWSFLTGSVCTHGLFWLRFHVGLGHESWVFWWVSDLVTWWFSPLGPILFLSHCELYELDKATIYCHEFLFHISFSCY